MTQDTTALRLDLPVCCGICLSVPVCVCVFVCEKLHIKRRQSQRQQQCWQSGLGVAATFAQLMQFPEATRLLRDNSSGNGSANVKAAAR